MMIEIDEIMPKFKELSTWHQIGLVGRQLRRLASINEPGPHIWGEDQKIMSFFNLPSWIDKEEVEPKIKAVFDLCAECSKMRYAPENAFQVWLNIDEIIDSIVGSVQSRFDNELHRTPSNEQVYSMENLYKFLDQIRNVAQAIRDLETYWDEPISEIPEPERFSGKFQVRSEGLLEVFWEKSMDMLPESMSSIYEDITYFSECQNRKETPEFEFLLGSPDEISGFPLWPHFDYKEHKGNCFISATYDDRLIANTLTGILNSKGIKTFFYRMSSGKNQDWNNLVKCEIESHIKDSSLFILICSNDTFESTAVKDELKIALKNKSRGENIEFVTLKPENHRIDKVNDTHALDFFNLSEHYSLSKTSDKNEYVFDENRILPITLIEHLVRKASWQWNNRGLD